MIGSTISHYRITGKIGEGGMGVVYRARDMRLDREVALKFLSADSMDDSRRHRFLQEARAAARVQHPNICPIYEINETDGRIFFAMALVEGETISDLIQRERTLPLETALDLAIQVAGGLDAAHRQGIVHRDIKCNNIIAGRQGHASILDFGVALREGTERITATGGAVGTPAYMSPEQAQGLDVDRRSDIWSLGVVLFEMLAGQLPFRGGTQFNVLYSIVKDPAPSISKVRPGLPDALEQALRKALAKEPDQRWQTAAEFAAALRRVRETLPQDTVTLLSNSTVTAPARTDWMRRGLIVLALLGLAAAYMGWRGLRPAGDPLPEGKQIAVLPLDASGQDENLRALADGLVETITTKLTQIEDLQGKLIVVPASEIRGRKITSAEAARRIYGANLVVTGSAQRWGQQIQLTLNLVDTQKMRQIAARTLEFDAGDPIALRDGAVNGVIRLLTLRVSTAGATAMASGETSKPGAYTEYLKGVGYLARYDVHGNVDRAVAALQEATRQDPKYALAWAALGDAYWKKTRQATDKRWGVLAMESIQRAIQLDAGLAIAHVRLSKILTEAGRTPEAVEEALKALGVAPDNADAFRALAGAYAAAGQNQEAEEAFRNAIRRQPADWYGHYALGFFYFQRGRDGEARTAWEAARKLTPDNELVHRNLAVLALREGRFKDASDMLERTLKYEPGGMIYSGLGVALYYQRRYVEAAAALNSAIGLNPEIYLIWGNLGTVCRHLPGKEQQASEAFLRAIELGGKVLLVKPGDYNARANMAEYQAKLGVKDKALAEIQQIPVAERRTYGDRLTLAYELSGERRRAVQLILSLPADAAVLNYIRRDPDLEGLWNEPELERIRQARR
jgi:serine/threonine-protein kinase